MSWKSDANSTGRCDKIQRSTIDTDTEHGLHHGMSLTLPHFDSRLTRASLGEFTELGLTWDARRRRWKERSLNSGYAPPRVLRFDTVDQVLVDNPLPDARSRGGKTFRPLV